MNPYDLYRDLARTLYALGLEAVQNRDMERVTEVNKIVWAAFEPLRIELREHSPVIDLMEYTNLATIKNWSDKMWPETLHNLEHLKTVYHEVLG